MYNGITNVDISIGTAQSDAKVAYFTHSGTVARVAGFDPSIGRFNPAPGGNAVILSASELNHGAAGDFLDAEAVAHEIGHTLGLRHVDPATWTDPTTGLQYRDVMKPQANALGDLSPLRFINTVSPVTDKSNSGAPFTLTENPVYYLKHYIDGVPDATLRAQGIVPGTWDTDTFLHTVDVQLEIDNGARYLYNVNVFAGIGDDASVLAHFDQITAEELATQQFILDEGTLLSLSASSMPGGIPDIAIARGNPYDLSNLSLTIANGNSAAQLIQGFEDGTYSVISNVSVNSSPVPDPTGTALCVFGSCILLLFRPKQRVAVQ